MHYQAPPEAYPQAARSGRVYRPEWEEQMLDLQRVYALLTQGRWYRETKRHGEFWLGLNLMAELAAFVRLPVYQLALPFSHEAWRKMGLARMFAGTTF